MTRKQFENLQVGQVIHDYHRSKDNNGQSREGHWTLIVEEIDINNRKVKCSWNTNPSKWSDERQMKKYRINPKE